MEIPQSYRYHTFPQNGGILVTWHAVNTKQELVCAKIKAQIVDGVFFSILKATSILLTSTVIVLGSSDYLKAFGLPKSCE